MNNDSKVLDIEDKILNKLIPINSNIKKKFNRIKNTPIDDFSIIELTYKECKELVELLNLIEKELHSIKIRKDIDRRFIFGINSLQEQSALRHDKLWNMKLTYEELKSKIDEEMDIMNNFYNKMEEVLDLIQDLRKNNKKK